MKQRHYISLVRGFGIYHALAILPLAIPIACEHALALLGLAHLALELPGAWLSPDVSQLMFINLFACAALVWAVYRAIYPSVAAGRVEGWGMLLFSAVTLFYVYNGASPLWLAIPLVDLPGGLMHLAYSDSGKEQ